MLAGRSMDEVWIGVVVVVLSLLVIVAAVRALSREE
jgi:hypothetical protein